MGEYLEAGEGKEARKPPERNTALLILGVQTSETQVGLLTPEWKENEFVLF